MPIDPLRVRTWAAYADSEWAGSRREQRSPAGDWQAWLILAGRGFGKTRSGVEWALRKAVREPRGALVAPTAADARDVLVEGESGVLACAPRGFYPEWKPSKRRLVYPNGAIQTVFSADEPNRLRGPQHYYAYVDEWQAMKQPQALLDMLLLGLRLGQAPQLLVTTTPKPTSSMKAFMQRPHLAVSTGSTYDNLANLAPTFREQVLAMYEGTSLGRQELYAEILTDIEGALWRVEEIDEHRVKQAPDLARIVVAIDPAGTSKETSDETGILVCGATFGRDSHLYVLEDCSGRYTPDAWARKAVALYEKWGADAVVAETNYGGEMVEAVLRQVDRNVRYRKVTATRGKQRRAEPIAALYEQGRAHHVGEFHLLEAQMTTWTPDSKESPDRMDALVWAGTELVLRNAGYASVA